MAASSRVGHDRAGVGVGLFPFLGVTCSTFGCGVSDPERNAIVIVDQTGAEVSFEMKATVFVGRLCHTRR